MPGSPIVPTTNVRLGLKWQQVLTDLLLVDAAPDHEGDEAAELVLRDHPIVILLSNSVNFFFFLTLLQNKLERLSLTRISSLV